jgi:hypothetical protein
MRNREIFVHEPSGRAFLERSSSGLGLTVPLHEGPAFLIILL